MTVQQANTPIWRNRTTLLWLLVLFVGIQFGAGLYEKTVLVAQWADLPGHQAIDKIATGGMKDSALKFWPFVSPPVAILAFANLFVAWRSKTPNRRWWIAGAAFMCAYAIFSYSYFVPQQLNLQYSAQSWSDDRIESVVAWWTSLNYVRMVIGAAGWLCAMRALSLSALPAKPEPNATIASA